MFEYCCDDLRDMLYGSDCLYRMTMDEVKNPRRIQDYSVNMDYEIKKVKLNEIYLYDEEYSQINGKPFSFCPYCGKNLGEKHHAKLP